MSYDRQDVAVDAVDEWLEVGSLPMHFEVHPGCASCSARARTLHFHATDTALLDFWLERVSFG